VNDGTESSCMQIVYGGGWSKRQIVGRPKARFFAFLSIMWLFVSVIASMAIWPLDRPLLPLGFAPTWLCSTLVILQAVFVLLAVGLRIFEKPRKFTIILR
jgi:hypothetical protein